MKKQLSPGQEIAVAWLAQPKSGGKTKAEVAELCGVSPRTLYNWERHSDFDAAVKEEMRRRNRDRLPELMGSLVDMAISSQNAAMAKLALQVNGMLIDQVQIQKKPDENEEIDFDKLDEEIVAFGKRFDEEVH